MMDTKLLAVLTPPSIYHGCSTRKTFWEEKLTLGYFTAVHMKKFGRCNIRKHRGIKSSDKYVTLLILSKIDSLDKMNIKSSESKEK